MIEEDDNKMLEGVPASDDQLQHWGGAVPRQRIFQNEIVIDS